MNKTVSCNFCMDRLREAVFLKKIKSCIGNCQKYQSENSRLYISYYCLDQDMNRYN